MESTFIVILLTLLLSAFFSGLEIAFLSANKLRIELKSGQGVKWAMVCARYIKTPSRFISTILVGNNIAIVIYGLAMERLLNRSLSDVFGIHLEGIAQMLIITFISTLVVLVLAEFVPKALFRINPTGILSVLIYPFQFFAKLLAVWNRPEGTREQSPRLQSGDIGSAAVCVLKGRWKVRRNLGWRCDFQCPFRTR